MILRIVAILFALESPVQAATYYISPTGSNNDNGLTTSTPWLTFSYAINAARAWCGDTLVLKNGTYGDGTSTGKIAITNMVCTAGDGFTLQAENSRQAKIVDSGLGVAVAVTGSSYWTIDGIVAKSTDNIAGVGFDRGRPFEIRTSQFFTIKNSIATNPNRYTNSHAIPILDSADGLIEGNEVYVFHRHCLTGWESERIVYRLNYCNPRGGRISGGFNASAGLGGADALISMYPCKDCIAENNIADGTTHAMYMNEMNATYGVSGLTGANILMSGSKLLGSVCYRCNYGNGIYLNSRNVADLNHSPQNILVRDIAIVDSRPSLNGIRCSDCVNVTLDHITILATGAPANHGIVADQTGTGATAAQSSITITNSLVTGFTSATGCRISSGAYNTWSGTNNRCTGNSTNFFPTPPSNWGTTYTDAHGMGTCSAWVPTGAAGKGQGTSGSDIGATVLYRYVNGVLTTTPLWDPTTGEFPHGVDDMDGLNNVADQSLKDFHTRININTGGCAFPDGYGSSGPDNPATHVTSTDLTGPHVHTVSSSSNRGLTVFVTVIYTGSGGAPAYATSLSSSCGGTENIPSIMTAVLTGTAAGHRSLAAFGLVGASSGTCTLTPTFSSANITGWVMESIEESNIGSYGTASTATALSVSPSVTSLANSDELIRVAVGTSKTPTLSAGPNQTLHTNTAHSVYALRLASSSQDGADGQTVSYTLSSSVYWAIAAIPIVPPAPGGPSGATRTLTKYRIECGFGAENTTCALGGESATARIPSAAIFRVRAEVSGGVDTSDPWGVQWYCQDDGGGYYAVGDSFGANAVRWIGPGFEPQVPGTQTATTQQLSVGNFVAGGVKTSASQILTAPSLTSTQKTELIGVFVLDAAVDQTIQCRPQLDNGTALNTYTVTPTILVIGNRSSSGH